MAICTLCGVSVGEGYKFCSACNLKNRQTYAQDKKNEVIDKMNWNLGRISTILECFLALQVNDHDMLDRNLKKLNKIKEAEEKKDGN